MVQDSIVDLPLSLAAARGLLAAFDIGELSACSALRGGLLHANYLIEASGQRYTLRLYPHNMSQQEIVFELSMLAELQRVGFPSPRVVRDTSGQSMSYCAGLRRYFTVFHFIEGSMLAREDIRPGVVADVGRLLARMQNALAGFIPEGSKSPADLGHIEEHWSRLALQLRQMGQQVAAHATTLDELWQAVLRRLTCANLANGCVHADLYFANVVVRDGAVAGIIDFGDCNVGAQIEDVAVALMEFSFVQRDHFDLELGRTFLRSYLAALPSAAVEFDYLLDCMICASFKFFTYTATSKSSSNESILANEYLHRIVYLSAESFAAAFNAMLVDVRSGLR